MGPHRTLALGCSLERGTGRLEGNDAVEARHEADRRRPPASAAELTYQRRPERVHFP